MSRDVFIDRIESEMLKPDLPDVRVGNTVQIISVIVEGNKKRFQKFEGDVVRITGRNAFKLVTVRRVIGGVTVEKGFLVHSPFVTGLTILKKNKIRRAKLYYLRDRIGVRSTRLKERAD